MKPRHTPGPWYSLGKSVMYNEINTVNGRDSRQRQMAEIFTVNGEANARLIAAAPELLEALIEANDHLGGRDELHHKIIALIAKATGGAE